MQPCDPQEVELLPAEGLAGSDILLVDLAGFIALSAALGQPVLRGLGDQEAGKQTQAEVDTGQGEQKVWHPRCGQVTHSCVAILPAQEVRVSEVAFVTSGLGRTHIVRIQDCSL